MEVWEEFMSNIEGVVLVEETKDRVIWAPSCFGKFSFRSFRRTIVVGGGQASER